MDAAKKKELEEKIKKDQHFIEKMHSMGEKWCQYSLIIDALKDAQERISENKAALEEQNQ